MASSSNAATCNNSDVFCTAIQDDEEAMWNRLLQVERDIEADRIAGDQPIEETVTISNTTSFEQQIEECQHNVAKLQVDEIKDQITGDQPRDQQLKRLKELRCDLVVCNVKLLGFKNIWSSVEDSCARFKSVNFATSFALLECLEDQQAASMMSSPRMCFFLSNFLVSDKQRHWESRFLKLLWRHSTGILDVDLLLLLSKLAEHYSPTHEIENLEEFLLTNEERATFLSNCSTLDKATCFAKDFNEVSLNQIQVQMDQKPKYWTQRDHTLHLVGSSKSVKPLETIFPFLTRFETAKGCLDRLDLLKSITIDLNLDESDTLASVLGSFKSPELQALHALKKEMELRGEVVVQLEQLNNKHLHAYETLSKDQHERQDEDEKRNMFHEALYKKVKYLASIKKISINRHAKVSTEDLLKKIIQKAGSTFKEVEAKLKKAQTSETEYNKVCTLCYSEFSKKRKRACLDPCGHARACMDCATKAWEEKPNCPWCKTSIEKLISVPIQMFF